MRARTRSAAAAEEKADGSVIPGTTGVADFAFAAFLSGTGFEAGATGVAAATLALAVEAEAPDLLVEVCPTDEAEVDFPAPGGGGFPAEAGMTLPVLETVAAALPDAGRDGVRESRRSCSFNLRCRCASHGHDTMSWSVAQQHTQ